MFSVYILLGITVYVFNVVFVFAVHLQFDLVISDGSADRWRKKIQPFQIRFEDTRGNSRYMKSGIRNIRDKKKSGLPKVRLHFSYKKSYLHIHVIKIARDVAVKRIKNTLPIRGLET